MFITNIYNEIPKSFLRLHSLFGQTTETLSTCHVTGLWYIYQNECCRKASQTTIQVYSLHKKQWHQSMFLHRVSASSAELYR